MIEVSIVDRVRCDSWHFSGQVLRAAIGWRYFRGEAEALAAVSGVSLERIRQFVETGEIGDTDRVILKALM